MGSSQADHNPSPVAFALQELIACWDQAYEALTRGDLDAVAHLLDIADRAQPSIGNGHGDGQEEARLRAEAESSRGRLLHGMRSGLLGLQQELGRVRKSGRALAVYGGAGRESRNGYTRHL